MDLFNEDLMYEFHVKDLSQTEALRQYADHAVKEIKSIYGWDTDVQVMRQIHRMCRRRVSVRRRTVFREQRASA